MSEQSDPERGIAMLLGLILLCVLIIGGIAVDWVL